MIHVDTYYRSIRRPQPACQSSHLGSIPGAQSAQSGPSWGAATCGAPHRLHSCFRQKSAERRGQVRSASRDVSFTCQSSRKISADIHTLLHQACQRKFSIPQVLQMKSDLAEILHSMLLYLFGNTVHYSLIPPSPPLVLSVIQS